MKSSQVISDAKMELAPSVSETVFVSIVRGLRRIHTLCLYLQSILWDSQEHAVLSINEAFGHSVTLILDDGDRNSLKNTC